MRVDQTADGAAFRVKAVPGASGDAVVGTHGDALKLRVAAEPRKGKANKAVVALLAKSLGVSTADVHLVAGATGTLKRIVVTGLDAVEVLRRLERIVRVKAPSAERRTPRRKRRS